MPSAASLLGLAKRHLGYTEGPKDNQTPFGAWTGTDFQPWCHAFLSKILDEEGVGCGRIAYCPAGVAWFRERSQLFNTPQPGDAFYLFFPKKGRYAHTGFVETVDGGWIVTCEGNSNRAGSRTGGSVVSLRRQWEGTRTVFGRPTFTGAGVEPSSSATSGVPILEGVLKNGSKGERVTQMQGKLGIAADGDFGPKTEEAVKAFQQSRGLKPDGQCGPITWAALWAQ